MRQFFPLPKKPTGAEYPNIKTKQKEQKFYKNKKNKFIY